VTEFRFKPNDEVDRYVILEGLAAGGMGEVYRASHPFTGRDVALKVISLTRQTKGDFKERMRAEAMLLAELKHPNICQLHDAGMTDDGMCWMAMELLQGRTLRHLLHKEGPLHPLTAVQIATEIADGLGAAHELRVFHRDLKPENIFITSQWEVKVLDFGAAKFVDRGVVKTTEKGRTIGTFYYMSPEQVMLEPVDQRADIYALGLIFHEMVTGKYPFLVDGQLPDRLEIGDIQMYGKVKPLPEVVPGFPESMWRVAAMALEKKRDRRQATMGDFTRELQAAKREWIADAQRRGTPIEEPHLPSQKGKRRVFAEFEWPQHEVPAHTNRKVVTSPGPDPRQLPTSVRTTGNPLEAPTSQAPTNPMPGPWQRQAPGQVPQHTVALPQPDAAALAAGAAAYGQRGTVRMDAVAPAPGLGPEGAAWQHGAPAAHAPYAAATSAPALTAAPAAPEAARITGSAFDTAQRTDEGYQVGEGGARGRSLLGLAFAGVATMMVAAVAIAVGYARFSKPATSDAAAAEVVAPAEAPPSAPTEIAPPAEPTPAAAPTSEAAAAPTEAPAAPSAPGGQLPAAAPPAATAAARPAGTNAGIAQSTAAAAVAKPSQPAVPTSPPAAGTTPTTKAPKPVASAPAKPPKEVLPKADF
jgi:eukaryotic-like serine/threonine-protein kinase